MTKQFYITTTLPYVNADPHIGFALEIIQADVIVRYQRLLGNEVFYNTGTDEHGLKIYRKAVERGIEPQAYCDEYAAKFRDLAKLLNLDSPTFIRTTDENHLQAAQEFWKLCEKNGDIYKKNYQVKYCVGCELEKTDSELTNNTCPIHPNLRIELINEENYFFKFSNYQKKLLELYEKNPNFVIPENRQKEITEFVKRGLEDFSISRLKEKMPWGVPVPGDEKHVMYVWFDALINYISTLGWPENMDNFVKFWGNKNQPNAVQVAGKDNLRQQSAMWQAMLMSAGIANSKQIFIHGFISSDGQKMSKSLGNVVNPYDVVQKYGVDPVRYFLLFGLPAYEDGDFTFSRFEEVYASSLANGLGNLTSRILTMLEKYSNNKIPKKSDQKIFNQDIFWKEYDVKINLYKFDQLTEQIEKAIKECDSYITKTKPWELYKQGQDISEHLYILSESLRHLSLALLPIIPGTAESILQQLGALSFGFDLNWGALPAGINTQKGGILFPRLS